MDLLDRFNLADHHELSVIMHFHLLGIFDATIDQKGQRADGSFADVPFYTVVADIKLLTDDF